MIRRFNANIFLQNHKNTQIQKKRYVSHVIAPKPKLDHHEIERVSEVRDLGVFFASKFTFSHQIDQITAYARQVIGYIRRTANGKCTIETMRLCYLAYVRSKLRGVQLIKCTEIISSQCKQIVIEYLGSRSNANKCKWLNIQPLFLRKQVVDEVLAYVRKDFFSSFVDSMSNKEFRINRLLEHIWVNSRFLLW